MKGTLMQKKQAAQPGIRTAFLSNSDFLHPRSFLKISIRPQLWNAEAEIDEDLADVDINMALNSYGQGQGVYEVGELKKNA
jgi:hypothetical protein